MPNSEVKIMVTSDDSSITKSFRRSSLIIHINHEPVYSSSSLGGMKKRK